MSLTVKCILTVVIPGSRPSLNSYNLEEGEEKITLLMVDERDFENVINLKTHGMGSKDNNKIRVRFDYLNLDDEKFKVQRTLPETKENVEDEIKASLWMLRSDEAIGGADIEIIRVEHTNNEIFLEFVKV
ncbi:hypothetical protein ACR9H8_20555 [Kosakonia cowanii]